MCLAAVLGFKDAAAGIEEWLDLWAPDKLGRFRYYSDRGMYKEAAKAFGEILEELRRHRKRVAKFLAMKYGEKIGTQMLRNLMARFLPFVGPAYLIISLILNLKELTKIPNA